MSKKFTKRYYGGEFRDLVKMYSFDRHVPTHQTIGWTETKEITPKGAEWKQYAITGISEVIGGNRRA